MTLSTPIPILDTFWGILWNEHRSPHWFIKINFCELKVGSRSSSFIICLKHDKSITFEKSVANKRASRIMFGRSKVLISPKCRKIFPPTWSLLKAKFTKIPIHLYPCFNISVVTGPYHAFKMYSNAQCLQRFDNTSNREVGFFS